MTLAAFKRRLTPGTKVRIVAPHGTRETEVQKVQTNAVVFRHPDPTSDRGSWHWWHKAGEYEIDGDTIRWPSGHDAAEQLHVTILEDA